MSEFMDYWRHRSCYCDEFDGKAICGSCYFNKKKTPERYVYISKLNNGKPLIKDLLGSMTVKAAKYVKDAYLTGYEEQMFRLQSIESANRSDR